LLAYEFTGRDNIYVLEIAHKYCMDILEERILRRILEASTTQEYVDMLLAARITGSSDLYEVARCGLIRVQPKPNWQQAQEIGLEAYFSVISGSTCKKCRFGPIKLDGGVPSMLNDIV
jgi:hypothetical protein